MNTPVAARRCFRLAIATGVALAVGYGLGLVIPFFPPLFVLLLGANPGPPPGPKQTLVLTAFLLLALGGGVLLGPLLAQAPASALLLIVLGLYFANRLAIVGGKDVPATLLAMGLTVIPAASLVSQALATAIVAALVIGVALAIASLWLVYPLFPEDPGPSPEPPAPTPADEGLWLSLRAALVVMPAFLVTLSNPTSYMPFLVKSILLGREATELRLREATGELLGSTALGGACAVAVWLCLSLAVELWFFAGWVTLACLVLAGFAYGVRRSDRTPGFWINTMTTMIILLGAAVQDSANGKDVYQAFVVRMGLFLAVSLYAVLAMTLLDAWRRRRALRATTNLETSP